MSNINQNVQQRITADKKEIKDPKIALRATSYTRNMLSEIKLKSIRIMLHKVRT